MDQGRSRSKCTVEESTWCPFKPLVGSDHSWCMRCGALSTVNAEKTDIVTVWPEEVEESYD
jgi:hypothetical protein